MCINVEANTDATTHLHARESILVAIDSTNRFSTFIHAVLCSIHAIRFSYEWNDLSSQPGRKKWKTEYRTQAFKNFHPDFAEYTQDSYEKKFKTFTSRHEKVIKARNNLRRMFVQVSQVCIYAPLLSPF